MQERLRVLLPCCKVQQDDQFPSCGEADGEGRDEGGGGLDQQPHLVTDPFLDLVDVAGRKWHNGNNLKMCQTFSSKFYLMK